MTISTQLLKNLTESFNLEELRGLAFRLGIDFDNIAGTTKETKAIELLLHLERRGRLAQLVREGRKTRGDVSWPDISASEEWNPLPKPVSERPAILIDTSHDQSEWARPDGIYGRKRKVCILNPNEDTFPLANYRGKIQKIENAFQIDANDMADWRGLIFASPYHTYIANDSIDQLVRWVHAGGRLLMLGYELSDLHHAANLNYLAIRFGVRFNTDIIAPQGQTNDERPYGEPVIFTPAKDTHPLIKDITKLGWVNTCSLIVEPKSTILVTTQLNPVAKLRSDSVTYQKGPGGKMVAGGNSVDLHQIDWTPVAALAPKALCGEGEVLAIGTWDLDNSIVPEDCHESNRSFIQNILDWLDGRIG